MTNFVEKRMCRRFVIPGAEARYKKTSLFIFPKGFSESYPVLDVSKGGLAFVGEEKFRRGKKLIVQLLVPTETSLALHATVRWQGRWAGSELRVTGVEFMPFGNRKGWNSPETLDILRRLDAKFGTQ